MLMSKSISIWILFFFAVGFHSLANFPAEPKGDKDFKSGLDKEDFLISIRAPKSVTPGKYATFILKVSNEFDFPLNLKIAVNKPDSWNLISKQEKVALAIGESQNVVFLMEIDRACEIGDQVVNFNFYDADKDVKLNEQIVTSVENIHKITIRALRAPRYVVSGQEFMVDYEIKNLGNCIEEFSIKSLNANFREKKISLAPNSTHIERVEEKALPNLKGVGYSSFGISVVPSYQEPYINSVNSIKTYPVNVEKSDKYHRFPIAASLIYFGARSAQPFEGNYQVQIKGKGNLDINKRHQLEFTIRAPDRLQIARVGNFDQYSAEYTYVKSRLVKTTFRLGDFSYNLTDLTEMFRWARGAGVTHTRNKLEVGAFINAPRFFSEIEYQYGAYSKYNWTKNWSTQASFMQKNYKLDGASPAFLVSLKNDVNFKNQKLTFEVSQGSRDDKSGYGGLVSYEAAFGRFSLNTYNIYTDKDYPGFYSNSIFSNTSLNYRVGKVSLFTSFFYNESNPEQDTIFTLAPYSINVQNGVSWHPTKEITTQLAYVYRFREDRFPDKQFSFRENGLRYLGSYSGEKWNAQANAELLETENLLILSDDNKATTFDVGANVSRTFWSKLSIGSFGQYLYTNRYSESNQSIFLYGGELGYSIEEYLKVRGSYRNNYLIDEYTTDRTLMDFGVTVNIGNHMLDLTSSHALIRNTLNRTDFFVKATYTYTMGVPLKRKEGLYALDGQVSAKNMDDVAGIVINISGQSVITDKYGHFVIDDLSEGVHYLHIEGGSLGTGIIVDDEVPIEVIISPDENNRVQFNVVRAGNITGIIIFNKTQVEEFRKESLPLFIVKASKGDVEFLTYTDAKGAYRFTNLAPGEWVIRIVGNQDPTFNVLRNNIPVMVKSTKTEKVDFEMKKVKRKIKFSDKVLDLSIKKD